MSLGDCSLKSDSSSRLTRLTNIDAMRGIASLAVAWFHFTNGNVAFLADGPLKDSGKWGWAGVEMFFVISGFIIPYTLFRGGYDLTRFPRFLGKRLIRLDPPYLVSICLIIGLGFASSHAPGFQGAPFSVTWRQLVLHLGYVNALFDEPWLNPVFWTLAIEFQYYLMIGAVFPLLNAKSTVVRATTFLTLGATAFLGLSDRFIFHYFPLFLLGVAVFYYRSSAITLRQLLAIVAVTSSVVFFTLGPVVGTVGLLSVFLLLFERILRSSAPADR